jgi:nitrous oxidase accessory protein NosD
MVVPQAERWMLWFAAVMFAAGSASGATLCVDQKAKQGCYLTITAALSAASSGDTINVAHGTYREQVIITKRGLSLIGANAANTFIEASGNPNGIGIYIDGLDNLSPADIAAGHLSAISEVVVRGFTVANARFEGLLANNASNITITENHVTGNNMGLLPGVGRLGCPGQPAWETSEGFDCGEGVHLAAVDHSIVANNVVDHNAGGILLSDETGPTHDVLITANLVTENGYECGITLASHPPAPGFAADPYGVFHNTVAGNDSSKNGLIIPGTGVGIGLFTSPGRPNTATYANVVVGNRAVGNGHPGIALHSHLPGHNLTDNQIVGNFIAGNGADTALTGPPFNEPQSPQAPTGIDLFGVSPLTGTLVTGNVIEREAIDVAIDTPTQTDLHLNDLRGGAIGIDNYGAGTVDARQNWWGCPNGPGAPGCSTIQGSGIVFAPWLTQPMNPSVRGEERTSGDHGEH